MRELRWVCLCVLALVVSMHYGCARPGAVQAAEFNVGDRVELGPLVYHVTEAGWRTQLGEFPSLRMPERKFLLIHLSATNGGGETVLIPQAELENSKGETFQELTDGAGVPDWLGLIRSLKPAATEQGVIIFDVPSDAYRLRLTEGADLERARVAYVKIPLTFEQ